MTRAELLHPEADLRQALRLALIRGHHTYADAASAHIINAQEAVSRAERCPSDKEAMVYLSGAYAHIDSARGSLKRKHEGLKPMLNKAARLVLEAQRELSVEQGR